MIVCCPESQEPRRGERFVIHNFLSFQPGIFLLCPKRLQEPFVDNSFFVKYSKKEKSFIHEKEEFLGMERLLAS
jgi:hypothetical protein